MSNTIGYVFYGVPLRDLDNISIYEDEVDDLIEQRRLGWHRRYNGNAHWTPEAFGIQLGKFDTCSHHIDVNAMNLTPTTNQIGEYMQLHTQLSEFEKSMVYSFGAPRVFILWGST